MNAEHVCTNSHGPRACLTVLPIVRPESVDSILDYVHRKCWRFSPCTSDACCSQHRRLRANDHPVWAEDARADREQPQNILHASFIVRLQEDRHRI